MELPIYCFIGDRPVKGVSTADGGMDVLAYDWDTGEFARDMRHLHTLVHPTDEDATFVDEATFDARVAELRRARSPFAVADEHIFLRHHDLFDRVLVLDPVTGDYREVYRTQKPASARLWTGFYVVVDRQAVGVFATSTGPVFFWNENRVALRAGHVRAAVEHDAGGGEARRFTLAVDGRAVFAVTYTPPPAGVDPYSDEDETFSDFFAWLAAALEAGGLFTAYAVDGDAARWDETPTG
jgi:hypothetical protein